MNVEMLNKYMKWFATFEQNYTINVCKNLFGKDSNHMWNIWVGCNKSLLSYYACIGKVHKEKLLNWGIIYMPKDLLENFKK